MDFIFDNIYLIVLAAAGLVQWWKSTQEAKKQKEDGADLPDYEEPFPYETYEDQFPEPVVPPPLPRQFPAPPPLTTVRKMEEELARQEALNEKLKEIQRAKQRKTEAKATAAANKANATKAPASLRSALSNRGEIRRAFILKEILDLPVGMR